MKFTISLNKDDFRYFNKFALAKIQRAPGMKWKVTAFNILYWFFLAFFVLEIYSVYDEDCCYSYEHLNRAMVAFGIWFVAVNVWQLIYMRLYVAAATDENGTVLGHWEIELSDSGIIQSNDLCSSTMAWQSIQSVEKDKHNLYLFTDKFKALILPLHQINQEIGSFISKSTANKTDPMPPS